MADSELNAKTNSKPPTIKNQSPQFLCIHIPLPVRIEPLGAGVLLVYFHAPSAAGGVPHCLSFLITWLK
jgi:hypothetical protein